MTANKDLGRRLSDLYEAEAARRAPDWLLEQALEIIDTTPQRRVVIRVPWKLPRAITYSNVAVAAAVVIAVGALGLAVLWPDTDGAGSPPVTPSASPSPGPSPSPQPALTETFESSRHGISVSHPIGWMVQPATDLWTSGVPQQMSAFADVICSWGGQAVPARSTCEESPVNDFVALASQPLAGGTGDDWIADQLAVDASCGSTEPVAIDGIPGVLAPHCFDGLAAFVTFDDRGYLIFLYGPDDVGWFKDIVATVELHPEDAIDGAPPPSP
jgi:hypothetical protein